MDKEINVYIIHISYTKNIMTYIPKCTFNLINVLVHHDIPVESL